MHAAAQDARMKQGMQAAPVMPPLTQHKAPVAADRDYGHGRQAVLGGALVLQASACGKRAGQGLWCHAGG